jgi:S-sulfo-L-cysteine synthase (3-phospho-L-serine-dependent)
MHELFIEKGGICVMVMTMVDLIGETPLVQLKLRDLSKASVYAKLEMYNPFGMKDRVAKQIILDAKRTGLLKDGDPIIESSSGTLALGIALVGSYLGHEVHIITDPRIDSLTHTKLRALGANIHVVEEMGITGGWQQARLNYLYQMLEDRPDAFWPRQYENPQNPLSYRHLADGVMKEIGQVDILVGSVGSGGSLCGTAERLKKRNADLKVVAVDAAGSSIFFQNDKPRRLQSGLGNSLQPKNVNYSIIDEVHWLNDEEAFNWTLELSRHEKIFAGNSSGSVYAVANWLSTQEDSSKRIVCIFPDRGDRYYNTFYQEDFFNMHHLAPSQLNLQPAEVSSIQDTEQWSYLNFDKWKCSNEKALIY